LRHTEPARSNKNVFQFRGGGGDSGGYQNRGIVQSFPDLAGMAPAGDLAALKASIEAAIALILEEHQDWNLLVRPHRLPLA
jgi:hypothetical protein